MINPGQGSIETSLPIDLDDMARVVAELQAQAQTQLEEKQVKAVAEISTKMFDRSAAYANIILVAGYAGTFTIWSFTRAQLPPKAVVAIALALLISLAAFVIFEVIKMIITARVVMKQAGVLRSASDTAGILRAIKIIDEAQASTLVVFRWYWVATMVVAVGSALIALALLVWNFVAVLLGLPLWPA